ncbi:hypothetical protein [Streptomyces sp. NPDC056948]|uniref:hypothetical protein n=1 Tax=Streptomyces sp. NPDC056948 TaxID=3345975 RepID=UPI003644583B
MSHRPTGPACGNNPSHPLTDGDRQAVADFRAFLEDRAALRDRIAEALREADTYAQLERRDDRERFADAVLAVLPPPVSRADVLREAAEVAEGLRQFESVTGARKSAQVSENIGILRVATELLRLADEEHPAAQPDTNRRIPLPGIPECGADCPCRRVPKAQQDGAQS